MNVNAVVVMTVAVAIAAGNVFAKTGISRITISNERNALLILQVKSMNTIMKTVAGLSRLAPNLRRRMDMSRCLMRRCGSGLDCARWSMHR